MDALLSGKELLFRALRHEDVPAVPWVPYAGVHAGKLKGYSAIEVLKDQNKLVDALLEVNKLYNPDGQPVVFDLQLEAEIYGCELYWVENSPPSVVTHPLADTPEIPARMPHSRRWAPAAGAGRDARDEEAGGRAYRAVRPDHRTADPGIAPARHRAVHEHDPPARLR
ncbi:MAG TPA: uroporphyrinogen decarboxylase family protein [Anaerolineaceae bacterium]|nr:uroporphyrinogen decarboxylase family protein [Anaerolineaceae bacterium]